MVQFYLLCEIYLLYFALMGLSDRYGAQYPVLFNMKVGFLSYRYSKGITLGLGAFIVLGLCFLPISPGPVFIGDLLPMVTIIYVMAYYAIENTQNTPQRESLSGYLCLGCALVHLLLPSLVIL